MPRDVRPPAKEPRLLRREATVLGALVRLAGYGGLALAFAVGTLAPALVGLLLVAGFAAAGAGREAPSVRVRLRAPGTVRLGQAIRLRATATADRPVALAVEQPVPHGFEVTHREAKPGRRRAEEVWEGYPRGTGRIEVGPVDVHTMDRWGMHTTVHRHDVTQEVHVLSEARFQAQGRRSGARHTVHALTKSRHGLEPRLEVETTREFRAGDRVRDIDWARTSRMEGMFALQRERANPRPVTLLVDATASMRATRRHVKLTTAMRLASGIGAAALAAGVQMHLVAFDEEHVIETAQASRGARFRDAVAALAKLRGVQHVAPRPLVDEAAPTSRGRVQQVWHVRQAVVQRTAKPRATRLDAALGAVARHVPPGALVVAILDAEVQPKRAEVVVDRLMRRGHKVILIVPATGAHHYRHSEARGRVLEDLVEAQRRRARLERRLAAKDVPLLVAQPGREAELIEEVARRAE